MGSRQHVNSGHHGALGPVRGAQLLTIISANMMVRATRGLQGLGLDDVDRLRASTK
jgi:hypothetical protein